MSNLVVLCSDNRKSSNLIDENINLVKGFNHFFDAYDLGEVIEVIEECEGCSEPVTVLFDKELEVDKAKFPTYHLLKWFEV